MEATDLNIWEAIEIGPFIPTIEVGNETIENDAILPRKGIG